MSITRILSKINSCSNFSYISRAATSTSQILPNEVAQEPFPIINYQTDNLLNNFKVLNAPILIDKINTLISIARISGLPVFRVNMEIIEQYNQSEFENEDLDFANKNLAALVMYIHQIESSPYVTGMGPAYINGFFARNPNIIPKETFLTYFYSFSFESTSTAFNITTLYECSLNSNTSFLQINYTGLLRYLSGVLSEVNLEEIYATLSSLRAILINLSVSSQKRIVNLTTEDINNKYNKLNSFNNGISSETVLNFLLAFQKSEQILDSRKGQGIGSQGTNISENTNIGTKITFMTWIISFTLLFLIFIIRFFISFSGKNFQHLSVTRIELLIVFAVLVAQALFFTLFLGKGGKKYSFLGIACLEIIASIVLMIVVFSVYNKNNKENKNDENGLSQNKKVTPDPKQKLFSYILLIGSIFNGAALLAFGTMLFVEDILYLPHMPSFFQEIAKIYNES